MAWRVYIGDFNANKELSEKPLDYILYCDVFELKFLGKQTNVQLQGCLEAVKCLKENIEKRGSLQEVCTNMGISNFIATSTAQLVEHPLSEEHEVTASNPGHTIPKVYKLVIVAPLLTLA